MASKEEEVLQGTPVSPTSSPKNAQDEKSSGKNDLLMRFFESDFFDAWIAVTYLHKTLTQAVHEYLCSRLYTLPEADVERYLSQLCQLCVSRPDSSLETAVIDLCAQSLRVAVKTYWLLLAISQDNPRNTHVAALRDSAEQAGLEGHWDLPFKDPRLPAPLPNSGGLPRFNRISSPTSQTSTPNSAHFNNNKSPTVSSPSASVPPPNSSPVPVASPVHPKGLPPLEVPLRGGSPDIVPRMARWRSGALSPDVLSRPLSPDGLGRGIYSSVFMDTGVEGLICESNDAVDIRGRRQKVGTSSMNTTSDQATPTSNDGSSQPGSATVLKQLQSSGRSNYNHREESPPNSPKRRETTFGATLDFVEALCAASSNLTVFQHEDRQWALQKALHSINTEMDRASRAGVAIWWPMGRSLRQRVVRLAYKESRLLNSHEKAPFTLFVEVINEAAAEAEVEAAAAAAAAELQNSGLDGGAQVHKLPPLPQEMEQDPAAAAAAAEGIPWVPHHHRRSSSVDTSSSLLMAATAVAAVQGSSASLLAPANGPPFGTPSTPPGPADNAASPSATTAAALPPPSLLSQRSNASTFATDISLADFASEASHSPPQKRPYSGGAPGTPEEGNNPFPMTESSLPPFPRGPVQGGGHWIGGSNVRLHPAHIQDLGSDLSAAMAALRGEAPLVSVRLQVIDDTPLETTPKPSRTNSGVNSEISNASASSMSEEVPATAVSSVPATPGSAKRAAVHPEPSTAFDTAMAAQQPACNKNGWMCKLGLCKTCNSAAKTPTSSQPVTPTTPGLEAATATANEGVEDATVNDKQTPSQRSERIPRVKVYINVQGGLNLSIKRAASNHRRMPSHEALLHVAREHQLPVPSPTPSNASTSTAIDAASSSSPAKTPTRSPEKRALKTIHGEKWSDLKARLRGASPHGTRPGWDVRCVIVKSGDDCRQELLAMQLISTFHEVFAEAQLPLWLRPYEVLVTSNRTALIEFVPNSPSIHTIKSKRGPDVSLRDHFVLEFGEGTPEMKRTQRNFVESMAAYSLICYLLQIKDRHNGNILIDDTGHVIHIDFGFMLSNSPGGVNFESAPFKLTRELLEVMDSDSEGRPSELFDYFKVLMIQGFLAIRRHSDRITLLVEMMSTSGCPCFKNKVAAVQGLKKRLALGHAEPAVVETVLGLISDSLDAWRTRQYDYYQRVLNGIL